MDTSNHFSLNTLFDQLGLDSDQDSMQAFLAAHRLTGSARLADASFWNNSQASFLREAIQEDSDWAEVVDQLDAELRH